MSDLEMTEKMLQRAKIAYTKKEETWNGQPIFYISVERGYCGFVSLFIFIQADGSLADLGAYEG